MHLTTAEIGIAGIAATLLVAVTGNFFTFVTARQGRRQDRIHPRRDEAYLRMLQEIAEADEARKRIGVRSRKQPAVLWEPKRGSEATALIRAYSSDRVREVFEAYWRKHVEWYTAFSWLNSYLLPNKSLGIKDEEIEAKAIEIDRRAKEAHHLGLELTEVIRKEING